MRIQWGKAYFKIPTMRPRRDGKFHDYWVHFPFHLVKFWDSFPVKYERDDSDLKKYGYFILIIYFPMLMVYKFNTICSLKSQLVSLQKLTSWSGSLFGNSRRPKNNQNNFWKIKTWRAHSYLSLLKNLVQNLQ